MKKLKKSARIKTYEDLVRCDGSWPSRLLELVADTKALDRRRTELIKELADDAKFLVGIRAKALYLASTAKFGTSKRHFSQFIEESESSVVEPGPKKRGKQDEAEKVKINASHCQAMQLLRKEQMKVYLEKEAEKQIRATADSSSSLAHSFEQPEQFLPPTKRPPLH